MKHSLSAVVLLLFSTGLRAQTGGDNIYEFLNLNHSAFAAATGDLTVSQSRGDLSLPYFNPALLTPEMKNSLTLNYSKYFADINYGYTAWAFGKDTNATFATGLSYINYGSFRQTDESGNISGTFKATEYAFNLIYSRVLDSLFTIGADIKPVFSHLERYYSTGICADIGITYINSERLLSAGFVIKNAGFQIKEYTNNTREPLPFEIQAGVTKSLAHAPFRFTITLRHLEKYDMTYKYDSDDEANENGFGENIMRHIVLGVELLPVKNFWAGAGFNYQRRAEMRLPEKAGSAGISWGFGFKTGSFTLSYGRDTYHFAGAANHFSLIFSPDPLSKNYHR